MGRRSRAIEALLGGRPGAFLTAWNPGSRKQPPGCNRRMNRALARHLRRLPHWRGMGQGKGEGHAWAEEHFLVQAAPRRAVSKPIREESDEDVELTPLR